MSLLVVPLGEHELPLLTLAEWDALAARRCVLFERPGHPLLARLDAAGVRCGIFDDEPDPAASDTGLVADPASPRILELARLGAEVTSGTARPPDSLTAALGAPVGRRAEASLATLAFVMARLRSDDGCPWDLEQTHESLKVHALEETYEVIEAITAGTLGPELAEELGDLLLQVVFHARIAEQEGRFDLSTVAEAIVAKLVRRHPHVFGDVSVSSAAEVVGNWEAIKRAEKERTDPFDDIPAALPALLAAAKIQKRAAALGFNPDEEAARRAAADGLEEGEVGDALFWVVAAARARGVDPETALLAAITRFRHSITA
ncbi:MAG TPA: nucleoside triphosphate pyrophosphohydrolase [Actinomycetota bacterium]|nr:nucleoside triphosphate pyrophosphohydrolase [Actinomycetota bacterium]